jgi:hypothetical protein
LLNEQNDFNHENNGIYNNSNWPEDDHSDPVQDCQLNISDPVNDIKNPTEHCKNWINDKLPNH